MKDKPPCPASRKINWKSSLDFKNHAELLALQSAMENFYTKSDSYYADIDYTADTWNELEQLEAQDILKDATCHNSVLEVGCGRANILKTGKIKQEYYTGIDFSLKIIEENRNSYPGATFHCIQDIFLFPVESGRYDFVFSHYVLEHCVFPGKFLDECIRVLKPGGTMSILCPDFLGVGRMSSQRSGFTAGTGREKLTRHRYLDAAVTGFDNKIRIPFYAAWFRFLARLQPRFYINLSPTCFIDEFKADVDAVYLTFENEIRKYLDDSINWVCMPEALNSYSSLNSHIYIKGVKLSND